jgi:ubiquinone/menaquinone biosynthesis C-methylase UbiE
MGRIYEATWGRAFAGLYDRVLASTEEAGLREMRRELLSGARGRTIDVGAGTGANLELYPDEVDELVLAEPSPHMAKRLRERAGSAARRSEVVEAPAEQLPYADDSFDTVVFTLVLCTVPDPDAGLAEAARVLRPDGRLLFLEHVRSENPRTARWQDRLMRPWRFFGAGCHCNRDTAAAIGRAGLRIEGLEHGEMPKAPPIVRPLIRGAATIPAQAR